MLALWGAALVVGCSATTLTVARAPRFTPMPCADPVEGSWEGAAFVPELREGVRLSLRIRRVAGDPSRLTGEIISRYWSGDAAQVNPPRCEPGAFDRSVRMSAEGTLRGNWFEFEGRDWRSERAYCGTAAAPNSYAIDHLIGAVDPSGIRIRAVDNDGDRAVNAELTFWRSRCTADADPATETSKP